MKNVSSILWKKLNEVFGQPNIIKPVAESGYDAGMAVVHRDAAGEEGKANRWYPCEMQ